MANGALDFSPQVPVQLPSGNLYCKVISSRLFSPTILVLMFLPMLAVSTAIRTFFSLPWFCFTSQMNLSPLTSVKTNLVSYWISTFPRRMALSGDGPVRKPPEGKEERMVAGVWPLSPSQQE